MIRVDGDAGNATQRKQRGQVAYRKLSDGSVIEVSVRFAYIRIL